MNFLVALLEVLFEATPEIRLVIKIHVSDTRIKSLRIVVFFVFSGYPF